MLAGAVVTAPSAQADTAPPSGTPATVSADALPTWQVNGVVWAQVVVGNVVYVTGSFTQARPPGVVAGGPGSVSANNIFAYDIRTGSRVAAFDHSLNQQGRAIAASPDGSRVYVGGDFTSVDGAARGHLAAFDTSSYALTSPAASLDGQVAAIVATSGTVYVGGAFLHAGGQSRSHLAALRASDGAVLAWAPKVGGGNVAAMTMTPDRSRVIVGGQFSSLNGVPAYGMGSVDATSGVTMPWLANQVIRDAGVNGAIDTLTSDGSQIYGGGWHNGVGANFEGSFAADPMTGRIIWMNDCAGDTYGVFPVGKVLYTVSHAHDCSPIGAFPEVTPLVNHHALAFTTYPTGKNSGPDIHGWNYTGEPDSSLLTWFPNLAIGSFTGKHQAAWSVAGNSSYVVLGGEFPSVNGVAQQGLVRFAVSSIAPNRVGPTEVSAPSATSSIRGTAQVIWRTAWDQDNSLLTYTLVRTDSHGASTTAWSGSLSSTFWRRPTMTYPDSGLTPGATYTYRVKVDDPFGNSLTSAVSAPVTVSGAAAVTGSYTALGPCRLFDTRYGSGGCAKGLPTPPKGPLGAGATLDVQVAGFAGVPADATAVVVNLTAVGATRATYLTAYPTGGVRPTSSNLNVSSAAPRPNLAVVPLSAGGSFSVFNFAGSVNLIADVAGYFAPGAGASFTAVAPCRVFDTRTGSGVCAGSAAVPRAPVGAGRTLKVKVRGVAGVPGNATAVVVNLTAVGATSGTWVAAWPTGLPRPTVSNLNLGSAVPTPNLAVVPIGADGTISLYNLAGSVNLLGDISGYFAPGAGEAFSTLVGGPCRLFDTRVGVGTCAGAATVPQAPVGAKGLLKVKVRGVGFIPQNATAVVLNLTGVGATAPTWVAAWPSGPVPVVSNLNLNNVNPTPNLAIVPIGADGTISLYNFAGTVDLLGDVAGYFAP